MTSLFSSRLRGSGLAAALVLLLTGCGPASVVDQHLSRHLAANPQILTSNVKALECFRKATMLLPPVFVCVVAYQADADPIRSWLESRRMNFLGPVPGSREEILPSPALKAQWEGLPQPQPWRLSLSIERTAQASGITVATGIDPALVSANAATAWLEKVIPLVVAEASAQRMAREAQEAAQRRNLDSYRTP